MKERMMRIALWIAGLLLVLVVALALWVRLAPSDPARWHVDPATTADPTTPNFARVDRVVALPPAEVAARIAAMASAEGAVRLAGDDTHATWIARTRLMGYPDYVSLRLTPEAGGTRIQALSRSRFGQGDMGVNAARLARWLPQ
jgi:hypothetical protein